MLALPTSEYARAVRARLPKDAFDPSPRRIGWLALHLAIVATALFGIARGAGGTWGMAALSLVVGHGFACMAFVAHETLHGAIVRGRRARLFLGWIAFAPFAVSPRLWILWHNRVHHGHTMEAGVDPDAYPTLAEWRQSRLLRLVEHASLARGNWLGVLSLLIGFPAQSLHMLARLSSDRRWCSRREQSLMILETLAAVAVWTALALWLGPLRFLFAYVIPLILGGTVLMSYILTNHSLSPYTDVNDPLLNTLTVTTPRVIEALHLQFGLHVEHHLFPSMSPTRAREVRGILQSLWPDRYQSLPLLTALWRIARSARIYRDPVTLVEPQSGRSFPTLLPAGEAPRLPAESDEAESIGALVAARALLSVK